MTDSVTAAATTVMQSQSQLLQVPQQTVTGTVDVRAQQRLRDELNQLIRSCLGPERVNQLALTETCYPPLIELVQKTVTHIFTWTNEERKYLGLTSITNSSSPAVQSQPTSSNSHHPSTPSQQPTNQEEENKDDDNDDNDEEEEEATLDASLPTTISHLHPHPLQAYESRYSDGQYRCNLCGHSGIHLVYSCVECEYDVHPECFQPNSSDASGIADKTTAPLPNPDPDYEVTEPLSADECVVELDFPPLISEALPILLEEGELERLRMIEHFANNPRFDSDPQFRNQTSFSFQTLQSLLDEWNNQHPDQPPLALTPCEGGVCLVLIGLVIRTLVWSAIREWDDEPDDWRRSTLRPKDLLHTLMNNQELSILVPFLNAPFAILDIESLHRSIISSTAYWPSASNEHIQIVQPHPFPRTTRFEAMLDETFQPNVEQFKQINSLEWYSDPGQVKQYAQQYAQLKLPPGDDYFYRQWGITPIAFYGGTRHGLSSYGKPKESEERIFTFSVPHPVSGSPVTFCLEIRCCVEFLVCTLWDMESFRIIGDTPSYYYQPIGPTLRLLPTWIEKATTNGLIVNHLEPATTIPTHQLMLAQAAAIADESERAITPKTAILSMNDLLATSSSTTTPIAVASSHHRQSPSRHLASSLTSPNLLLQPHPLLNSQPIRYVRLRLSKFVCDQMNLLSEHMSMTKKKMDRIDGEEVDAESHLLQFPQALVAIQLFAYELYPTGLWSANHPLAVRHYFTQELIREQSRLAGLPELPNDLLHLIGEYEPAQLPCPPTASTPLSDDSPTCPWFTPDQLAQHDQYQQRRARFISHDCQIDESHATVVRVGPTAS